MNTLVDDPGKEKICCCLHKKIAVARPNSYPVPGGWGKKGATFIELNKEKKGIINDTLVTDWRRVAPHKRGVIYLPE